MYLRFTGCIKGQMTFYIVYRLVELITNDHWKNIRLDLNPFRRQFNIANVVLKITLEKSNWVRPHLFDLENMKLA